MFRGPASFGNGSFYLLDQYWCGWLQLQGLGPYANLIKKTEKDIKEMAKKVNDLCGMLIFARPGVLEGIFISISNLFHFCVFVSDVYRFLIV